MRSLEIFGLGLIVLLFSCTAGWGASPFGKSAGVSIDRSQMEPGKVVELNLQGVPVRILGKRAEKRAEACSTWIGSVQGGHKFDQAIITTELGHVAGNVAYRGRNFHLHSDEWGRVHATEVNQESFPAELDPIPAPNDETASGMKVMADDLMALDDGSTIDVMIVYTPKVAASVPNLPALLQLAVDETNLTYANTGVKQRVRLVHAAKVNYMESGNISTDLTRLRSKTDGYMDDVHALRNQYGADLVSLWVHSADGCGIAYVMTTVSRAFESSAFSVVRRDCATGYYSQSHEWGHNMGSVHDIYVTPNPGAHSYSHGFADPQNGFTTVMAYNTICTDQRISCKRIPYWSCPDNQYNGYSTGDAALANNQLSLNNTGPVVSNFRASKPLSPEAPGGIQKSDLTGEWKRFIKRREKNFVTALRITNVGQAVSGSFKVYFYRSTDGTDLTELLRTRIVRKLPAGRSIGLSNIFRFPKPISGEYIIAVVDAENHIDELDKENNRVVYMVP